MDYPLACPLAQEDKLRLNTFLSSTYWANGHALKCVYAAASLALHGLNVDRAFWSSGPGGVGQSLVSHLIDATFADGHRWVDMNVYFSDNEMRKQAELLAGAIVVTGQESPETDQAMREDVFKRHITGDPISCRLPYAVLTKMIALVGWKRYEMNELLRFAGTTEHSFMSVFRRSLVIIHKARFVSKSDLNTLFPNGDGNAHGYFERDQTLKEFVTSKRAAHAFMSQILGFIKKHDVSSCRQILDDYAEGGDDGVTFRSIRRACNLPEVNQKPKDNIVHRGQASDSHRVSNDRPTTTVRVESLEERSIPVSVQPVQQSNARHHAQLIKYCIENKKDLITSAFVSRTKELWPHLKTAKERVSTFEALVGAGLVKVLPKRGKAIPCIPVIPARKNITEILPLLSCVSLSEGLPECISEEALANCEKGCQLHNLAVIHSFLDEQLHGLKRPGAGNVSLADRIRVDELERLLRKSSDHRACLEQLLSIAQASVKTMQEVVLSQDRTMIKKLVQYAYKFDSFGRKYSTSAGAQRMSRRVRTQVLPRKVVDMDLKNAMTSLVAELLPRLELTDCLPADMFQAWCQYAQDADGMREAFSKRSLLPAKTIILRVAHGGSPPDTGDVDLNEWLHKLSSESRVLRWVAASQLPELHAWAIDQGKDWPENTTFAYFWHTIEDRVLTFMTKYTMDALKTDHISLHFDGLMCEGDGAHDMLFKDGMEKYVFENTGLRLSIAYKEHRTWLECLLAGANAATSMEGLTGRDEAFWMQPRHTVPLLF